MKFFAFQKEISKLQIEVLKSETLYLKFHYSKLEVSLLKILNLKFHIFICILVLTITHHIYDS